MWLLRLFPAYRALEAELAESASHAIQSDDDVRFWKARTIAAEERSDRLEGAEAKAAKMIANFTALQLGQEIVPFPDVYAPVPRKEETAEVPVPRRRQAREVADEMDREFHKEFAAMVDRDIEQQKWPR